MNLSATIRAQTATTNAPFAMLRSLSSRVAGTSQTSVSSLAALRLLAAEVEVGAQEGSVTISNLAVSTGKDYEVVAGLDDGVRAYIDRNYQYSDIPSFLKGATYIRTSFDDRYNEDSDFLQFDVDQATTVYVVHDDLTPLPGWMSGFEDTGKDLSIIFPDMSVYSKDFPAGRVVLGGNATGYRMYTVVIPAAGGGQSQSSTAPLAVRRDLQAGVASAVESGEAGLAVRRDLNILAASMTSTSAIMLAVQGLINLAASIMARTNILPPPLAIRRDLTAQGAVGTRSSQPPLSVQREMVAALFAGSTTGNPDLAVNRALSAGLTSQCAASTPGLSVLRELFTSIAPTIYTSTATLVIQGLINFAAMIAAQAATSSPELDVARPMSADVQGGVATSTSTLAALRDLQAAVTSAAESGEAVSEVLRSLSAGIDARSFAAAIALITGGLGVILDPTIESLTPARRIESLTPARTIESLTPRRTVEQI